MLLENFLGMFLCFALGFTRLTVRKYASEDMRRQQYLIEREVAQYMAEYEVRLTTDIR